MTSQPPEGLRDAVARIIDPSAWRDMQGRWWDDSRWLSEEHRIRCLTERQGYALAKADAILALISPPKSEEVAVRLRVRAQEHRGLFGSAKDYELMEEAASILEGIIPESPNEPRADALRQGEAGGSGGLCEDCPPVGYPTDITRCLPCPRRAPEDQGR